MTDAVLNAKARRFRELCNGPILVLPNVWDAAGAALAVRAGATAVATTSGGVAWSLGRPDGQGTGREEMAQAVRRIAAAVDVPVTADMEGGYGPGPEDVAATVRAAIDAGAAGINLEDSQADGTLVTPERQAERIRAGREAADAAGVPDFFINARTDVFLFRVGAEAGRTDDVAARAGSYAKAGADGLFVPGVLDLDVLTRLVAAVALPVNVMAGKGGPSVTELAAVGVRRVTVGTAIAQAAYGLAERAMRELLGAGTCDSLEPELTYSELNALFAADRKRA
ncbi:isocitrate lyase/phosphoenolpyruvate mutase family protein [Actinoplanes sp. NPDC023801]|uniref:isocitrate lyase/PEP mutase family protein n=1 Tax=Actinoplanes sp. NPDC023801 TaxID=3154595 RepID=UPI0033F1EC8D